MPVKPMTREASDEELSEAYDERFSLRDVYNRGKADAAPRWIAIETPPTECGKAYYYVDDNDAPAVAELLVEGVWFDRARDTTVYPLWWMPIPEVPWDKPENTQ
jgi:hypothetical protein